MRLLQRRWLVLGVFFAPFGWLVALAGPASACTMATPARAPTDTEMLARADAVFVGMATGRLDTDPVRGAIDGAATYRFEVRHVEKGRVAERQDVVTGGPGWGCPYPFEVGAEYLVFAVRGPDGALHVRLGDPTRRSDLPAPYRMTAVNGGTATTAPHTATTRPVRVGEMAVTPGTVPTRVLGARVTREESSPRRGTGVALMAAGVVIAVLAVVGSAARPRRSARAEH